MAKGFDRQMVQTVYSLYVVSPNICHCVIVAYPRSDGLEIIISCRFLGGSVVVTVGAFSRCSQTGDVRSFLVKLLDGAIA